MVLQNTSIDRAIIVSKMRKKDIQTRSKLNSFIMSTPEGCAQLLLKAVEYFEFKVAEECLKAGSKSLKTRVDIISVLKSHQGSKEERQQRIEFIEELLQLGCLDPNEQIGEACPLDVVLALSKEYQSEKEKLVMLLLQHGASIKHCTYQRSKGTTLVHEATRFAIDSGDALGLLEEVCKHFPYENYPDGKLQDKSGNTPYHLVMERKKSPNAIKICEILSQHPIDPTISNCHGKKPGDGRSRDQQERKDKRYIIMQEAAKKFQAPSKKKTKKKASRTSSVSKPTVISNVVSTKPSQEVPEVSLKHKEDTFDDEDTHDISKMLTELSRKPPSYFDPPPTFVRQRSKPRYAPETLLTKKTEPSLGDDAKPATSALSTAATGSEDTNIDDISCNFEDSPWEVECTDKVKKFFANSKVQRNEKEMVVKAIKKLVDGIPMNKPKLCKEVRSDTKLFEAHYSKGSRIIFEIAVQFSPRLTEKNVYIYSEVIRLWDIVRDHDRLNRRIEHVHECIVKSQLRGKKAAIHVPLKTTSNYKPKQSTQNQVNLRLPQCYIGNEYEGAQGNEASLVFTPAGSTKDDEYNVITFYSFDSSFVKSMLDGENARRDFPFKEWPKEHDIINMAQGKVSILLLGRSGTGKTTCCLYRLWNQFQNYWRQVNLVNSEPCFPHRPLAILQSTDLDTEESQGQDSDASSGSESESDGFSRSSPAQMQHYHQVFITKNYVLCAQMKKRFYDLAAGCKIAEKHMAFEDAEIPTSFATMEDRAYPLFLTARQFFILLDNSLHDAKAPFFPRNEEGKLAVKIVSSDYDHEDPDTLLDLEESDSEDDDADQGSDFDDEDFKTQPPTEKRKLSQRREITASYFAEKIWPKISKNVTLHHTKIDPLLVWMEIKSFIKGSMRSVEKEEGCLSEEEYEALGKKMAPNYVDKRSDIYKIFKLYQNYMKHHSDESIFDECDLNHSIYIRLNALKDLPWSIHSIYIDEVQDFTQAELSILIRICREPNDLFLTGDTAQSIMRGISFRFGDLKSIFYRASQQASKSSTPVSVKVPKKVNELTINFRSHTGILQLAASVIVLMKEFFPNSFDFLPGDKGMFPGPTPIVLDSCNVSDLALVLRTNKRESSTIEFGAHQVIIVQSEEAKKSIPDVLKAGIVLTVFEAKGLEFDDVLLYNFFKDSMIEKDWRVIASFTEDHSDQWSGANRSSFNFSEMPRRLDFDESQHKSLNAELKYLYTAITRAKCNLWMYDSDKDRRLPMFDYWSKQGLVKVISVDDITEEDQSTLFSATSSVEEWKSQGDYFKKKKLWEPATKCYRKANCPHLESEARAYSLAQKARTPGLKRNEVNAIYLEAAHAFLKCDQSQHDYQCLDYAARCLKNAKKYKESSQLYIYLGQNDKALKGYRRARDAEGLAKIKEKQGDYDGAIRLLLKHNRITDALKYAAVYKARRNVKISECYHVHYMANLQAEKLAKPTLQNNEADLQKFEAVMQYLKPTERVGFYKAADMHERACEHLQREGRFSDLFRIYKAQGWNEEGIQIAKSIRRREDEAAFIFFKATTEMGKTPGKLQDSTIAMLKKKMDAQSETGAKACLIYGAALGNNTTIRTARDYYTNRKQHNSFGQIEAFSAALARVEYDSVKQTWMNISLNRNEDLLSLALTICKEIRHIIAALDHTKEPSSVQRQVISQLERFYGLEKKTVGEELHELYFVPFSSYPWTNQLLEELKISRRVTDMDGMLQLEVETVYKGVCARFKTCIQHWIIDDQHRVVEHFVESFTEHPLHQEMTAGRYLHQSFRTHSSQSQQEYFRLLCIAFDLAHYGNQTVGEKSRLFKFVLNSISLATSYSPVTFEIQSDILVQKLNEQVMDILTKKDEAFHFNRWFEAWCINCVTRKGSVRMREILFQRSQQRNYKKSNKEVDTEGFQSVYRRQKSQDTPPPVYVLDRNGQYQHLMLLWLRTCELFREKETLASCSIAVYNIVRHIASQRSIWTTISVSNLLYVVTIHTTAILTMHAACSARFQREGSVYIPLSHRNGAKEFHGMNYGHGSSSMDFHRSCIHYIMYRKNLSEVPSKLLKMLTFILKAMIGMHNMAFNPLRYALGREECLKNSEARHCLIFVFTLFCNIGLVNFNPSALHAYRHQIYESVKECKDPTLVESSCRFLDSRTLLGCFGALRELLESSEDRLIRAHLFFNPRLSDVEIKFDPASLKAPVFHNQQQLVPFPHSLKSRLQHSKSVVMQSSLRADAPSFHPTSDTSGDNQGLNQVKSASPVPQEPARSNSPPQFQSIDSIEDDEEDAETSAALIIKPPTTAPEPQLDKDSAAAVDHSFCSICAHPVTGPSSQIQSADEAPIPESAESLYHSHCCTEEHLTNEKIKEQFDSEEKDYFIPRTKEVLELLPKCRSLYKFQRDDRLRHIVEATEGDMKEMDEYLLRIRNSAEWREGVHKLRHEYSQKLQLVHMTVKRQIEETEQIKRKIESDEAQQEKEHEEEVRADEEPEEDEEIGQTRTDYGEKGKAKKRQRRRDRKFKK